MKKQKLQNPNTVFQIIYTIFLGALVALFIGFGVQAFYPRPVFPEYPPSLSTFEGEYTKEQEKAQQNFNAQMEAYEKSEKIYSRNASVIVLTIAAVLLVAAFVFERKLKFIANGIMLGGLFTLLYAVTLSFTSGNSKYIFAVVGVGLLLALYFGYRRFVRGSSD